MKREGLIENRYRILSVIGEGGMGTLYRVSDEANDNAIFGLKTMQLGSEKSDELALVESFQNEFQLLTQLNHPNLVSVNDFGSTSDGQFYFTMEWIEGGGLDFGEYRCDVAESIPVMVQICRALAYLHARGVIHGDLKASNILMAGDQVRIVDFGLAFKTTSLEMRPQYYTPGFSAPEIRQHHPFDHRIDLYSLGAIWYALIAGEPPMFMAGSEYLIRLTLDELMDAQSGAPVEIVSIIERLLAEDPMDRFGSANEVIEAISRVTGTDYALETQETAGSYALRGRFVGREKELETLKQVWRRAQSEKGWIVLVRGESGVGKTRLVEEFVIQVELEGGRLARGQCVESGASAYGPLREVLRLLLRYLEGGTGSGIDMKRLGPVLATLLPELWQREYMSGVSPAVELEPRNAQHRLNEAILQVLRAAGNLRPTVVVIEDAQWADKATLELIQFLTQNSVGRGLVVCATYRDDGSDPSEALNSIPDARVENIQLPSLSMQVTTELVGAMLGLEQVPLLLTERMQQMTAGNAFFVKELVRSLAEEGVVLQRTVEGWHVDNKALSQVRLPDSIRTVVWNRMGYLSFQTQQVLRLAAISGSVFWDGLVVEISGIHKRQVQVALAEALEKEFIFERESSVFDHQREFLFAKPAVQDVAYDAIPQQERLAFHRQVSSWLMAHSDEQTSEHLGLIADQLEKGRQMDKALVYLTRAGHAAADQYANTEAVGYFSRALDLTPDKDVVGQYNLLLAREKVYDLQGSRFVQGKDLTALEGIAERMADDRLQSKAALRRAGYADATGDFSTAISACRKAIRLARSAGDVNGEAAGYMQSGRTLWGQGHYEASQEQLKKGLDLAQLENMRQLEAKTLLFIGTVSWYQGYYEEAKGYCDQALIIERDMGNPVGEVWILNMIGILYTYLGDYSKGRPNFELALTITEEIGDQRAKGTILDSLSRLYLRWGRYDDALICARDSLRITRAIGDRRMEGYALTTMGHVLEKLHKLEAAGEYLSQSLSLRRELGQQNLAMESLAGLAGVSLARGDVPLSLAQIEEVLIHLEAHGLDGTEERFQIYMICYTILRTIGDSRANLILESAYHLLQRHAARIEEPELRRLFLESIPYHRAIIQEWEQAGEHCDIA